MSALDHNPDNINFLSPFGFSFRIKKAPNTNFFLQKVNLPGISLPETIGQGNPLLVIPKAGDHLVYETLDIVFKVDENLANWIEIHNWIRHTGKREFQEYADLKAIPRWTNEGLLSDITIHVLNSMFNPIYEIVFADAYPIMLSNLVFDTTNPDLEYLTAHASFKYLGYDLTPVNF